MSNIPEVMASSADNVRLNFERLGDKYLFDIVDVIAEKQPMITTEIYSTLKFIEAKLSQQGISEEIIYNIMDNVVYRMFAILKALYIQEEVNGLEHQHQLSINQVDTI